MKYTRISTGIDSLDEILKGGFIYGANVLRKENDTIADNLILSIFEIMELKKLSIKRTSLGGYERRIAKLALQSGRVTFTLGDKSEVELFNFINGNTGRMSYE